MLIFLWIGFKLSTIFIYQLFQFTSKMTVKFKIFENKKTKQLLILLSKKKLGLKKKVPKSMTIDNIKFDFENGK